jgi:hypothetical protein
MSRNTIIVSWYKTCTHQCRSDTFIIQSSFNALFEILLTHLLPTMSSFQQTFSICNSSLQNHCYNPFSDWCSYNTLDFCSGGVWFESEPEHQLSWHVLFISHSLQAKARILPQLGHDHSLPNPFQFIIHQSSYHSTLCNLENYKINDKLKNVLFQQSFLVWWQFLFIVKSDYCCLSVTKASACHLFSSLFLAQWYVPPVDWLTGQRTTRRYIPEDCQVLEVSDYRLWHVRKATKELVTHTCMHARALSLSPPPSLSLSLSLCMSVCLSVCL